MDALVKAALEKVNDSVGKIFELKESDYPTAEALRKPEPTHSDFNETYDTAKWGAISKAVRAIDALRSAVRLL